MSNILTHLDEILISRRDNPNQESYVSSLHKKGLEKILEKVGEEATETIIAAMATQSEGDISDVVYETADLWFHSLVMLSHLGQDSKAVLQELNRRFGTSGLDEKASRSS